MDEIQAAILRIKLKNLDKLSLIYNPDLVELPNSIRFVKQAIINGNNVWREDPMGDYMEVCGWHPGDQVQTDYARL